MSFDSSSSEDLNYPTSTDESTGSSLQFLLKAHKYLQDTASSSAFRPRQSSRRDIGLQTLMTDWFVEEPIDDAYFRRKFRMDKSMFLSIVDDIEANFPYFQEGYDARGKRSFLALQKITSAVRQLATGNAPDENDEYLCMSARTSRETLDHFCDAIIKLYGREYLRRPTQYDVARIFEAHEAKHHIPGMLGSIDCTHIEWRNCPKRLRGQYTRGDYGVPTIMIEITASQDLDTRTAPNSSFSVNGRDYKRGYHLTDGIYNKWLTLVKAYPYPTDPKEKKFKRLQEAARKDVERAFSVLKKKWKILIRPLRPMTKHKIGQYVYALCILHNMIIKRDGRAISPVHIMDPPVEAVYNGDVYDEIQDEDVHHRLRFDLTEHVAAQNLPYLNE
uniref:uncharacterized protein LOC122601884 n=1 Tax=Erigeron canadensis TaxID=72917 RepID=UPI001CB92F45|nr:uncharacterized protein LOC122601884 [Erigeron canadensis]